MASDLTPRQAQAVMVLRVTIVLCLLIAAINVLNAFLALSSYLVYLDGKITAGDYPEAYEAFQKIAASPYYFLGLNLYNIVVWNLVILSAIWLWRYHIWARKLLKNLLGLDMILTVVLLLWDAWNRTLLLEDPGWIIALNTIQVLSIITLSHPHVMDVTEELSPKRSSSLPRVDPSDER